MNIAVLYQPHCITKNIAQKFDGVRRTRPGEINLMTTQKDRVGGSMNAHRTAMGLTQGAYAAWLNQQLARNYDRQMISKWETDYQQIPDAVRALITRASALKRPNSMVTITVANQKGGVGKTMVATNLAYYLATTLGYRVLLVDADHQANASMLMGLNPAEIESLDLMHKTLYYTLLKGVPLTDIIRETPFEDLWLAPAGASLAAANSELPLDPFFSPATAMKRHLNGVASSFNHYDFCVIDCRPDLDRVPICSMAASAYVLIPTQTEVHSLVAVQEAMKSVMSVKTKLNYDLKVLGIVPNMMMSRNTQDRQTLDDINTLFKGHLKIFDPIPRLTAYGQNAGWGRPTLSIDPLTPGVGTFRAIAETLIADLQLNVQEPSANATF